MHGKLAGYKTYVTLFLGVLTAWLAYLTGDLEKKDAVTATFAAGTAAALRNGITTEVKKQL